METGKHRPLLKWVGSFIYEFLHPGSMDLFLGSAGYMEIFLDFVFLLVIVLKDF